MLKGNSIAKENEKPKKIKMQNAIDQMKQVVFRQKGKEWIMSHNNVDLAYYSGDLPYIEARKGFESPNIPKWKMEKRTEHDILTQNLKISTFLPHQ